jgi:hypothetical protein
VEITPIEIERITVMHQPEHAQAPWAIKLNQQPLKTPAGKLVQSGREDFIRAMAYELERREVLDVRELSLYSMFSTYLDYLCEQEAMPLADWQALILRDVCLTSAAGPEVSAQLARQKPLLHYLNEIGVEHPGLPQTADALNMKLFQTAPSFAVLVEKTYRDFCLSDPALACIAINSHHTFGSVILGGLLGTGKITPVDYAECLLAAEMVNAREFGDLSIEEHREAFASILIGACTLSEFRKLLAH